MRAPAGMLHGLAALVIAVLTLSAGARADESAAQRVGDLLARHHYQQVVDAVTADTGLLGDMQVLLALAVALQKNAELHELLFQHGIPVQHQYLRQLLDRKNNRSRLALLAMAENRLAADEPEEAERYLDQFLAGKTVQEKYRQIARILKATIMMKRGLRDEAALALASVKAGDLDVRAELQNAWYLLGGEKKERSVREIDAIADEQRRKQGALSVRVLNVLLSIHAGSGEFSAAWERLRGADTGRPVAEETLPDGTLLRFYSAQLAGNISVTYRMAAMRFIDVLARVDGYGAVAAYLRRETMTLFPGVAVPEGDEPGANTGQGELPPLLAKRSRIHDVMLRYRNEGQVPGERLFDELAVEFSSDPLALTDMLTACYRLKAMCRGAFGYAGTAAQREQGDLYRALQSALGMYQLGRGNREAALEHLEAGRDKSQKNRIDANEPLYLLQLADLYRRAGTYSEHLEIYFELAAEFPVVRGIQEAVQGVYATDARSAGDVKLY